jgi:hypothetical protein
MLSSVLLEALAPVSEAAFSGRISVGTRGAAKAVGAGRSPDSVKAGFFEVTVVPWPAVPLASGPAAGFPADWSDGELAGALSVCTFGV